jgi:hypothetical protein
MEFTIKHTRRCTLLSIQVPHSLSTERVEALLHKCVQEVKRELSADLPPRQKTTKAARVARSAPKRDVNLVKGSPLGPAVEQCGPVQLPSRGEPKTQPPAGPVRTTVKSSRNQASPPSKSSRRRLRRRAARRAGKEARKSPTPGLKDGLQTDSSGHSDQLDETSSHSVDGVKRLSAALQVKCLTAAELATRGIQPYMGPRGVETGWSPVKPWPTDLPRLSLCSVESSESLVARWSRAVRDVEALSKPERPSAPERGTVRQPPPRRSSGSVRGAGPSNNRPP